MLEHVRIHPELVTGTKDHELDPTRSVNHSSPASLVYAPYSVNQKKSLSADKLEIIIIIT